MIIATLGWLCLTAGPGASAAPSVAIMQLVAKGGVKADTAELVTENLVAELRSSRKFARVVTMAEVQATLSFDVTKQLTSCDSTSCMAELAGTLGVDLLIVGSLGKVGELWVFNVTLLDAHTGNGLASVSRRIKDKNETGLLLAVEPVVAELLKALPGASASGSAATTPPPSTTTAAPSPQPAPQPSTVDSDPNSQKKSGSKLPWVLRGVGAAALVAAIPIALVGLASVGVALGLAVVFQFVVAGLDKYWLPLQAVSGVGAGVAVVGFLATMALLATGVAMVGASLAVSG